MSSLLAPITASLVGAFCGSTHRKFKKSKATGSRFREGEHQGGLDFTERETETDETDRETTETTYICLFEVAEGRRYRLGGWLHQQRRKHAHEYA